MGLEGRRGRALQVVIAGDRGRQVSAPGLARWLVRVAPGRAHGIVSVALVGDACVQALNKQYRRRDSVTDVLSFPGNRDRDSRPRFLGDIVIARGLARRQARAAGHSEATELRILALHGLLHLLGYDHERDRGQMARLERSLRLKGGLGESLTERAKSWS